MSDVSTPKLSKEKLQQKIEALYTVERIATKKNISKNVELLYSSIKSNALKESLLLTLSGIIVANEQFIDKIKSSGIFRPSKYQSSTCIETLINSIESYPEFVIIEIKTKSYFTNIRNLIEVWKKTSHLIKHIKRFVQSDSLSNSIFKTITSYADLIAFSADRSSYKVAFDSYLVSREETIECLSTVLYYFFEASGNPTANGLRDARFDTGKYDEIIDKALLVNKYLEFEVLIDRFDYNLVSNDNMNFILEDTIDISRHMRTGYALTERQHGVAIFSIPEEYRHCPISDKIESGKIDDIIRDLFELREFPDERVVFKLIDPGQWNSLFPSFEDTLKRFFLLQKEMTIGIWAKDLYCSVDDLLSFKITTHASIADVLSIQAAFTVYTQLLKRYLKIIQRDNDSILILNTLVPEIEYQHLFSLFSNFMSTEAAEEVLDLMTYSYPSATKLDLQYKPILDIGNGYRYVLCSSIAISNAIRNSLVSTRKRLYADGTQDPLPSILANALKERGFHVGKNFKIPNSEIDVIAKKDNHIFLFECKNSLLPTSIFELRTSLDYVQKASAQIEKAIYFIRSPDASTDSDIPRSFSIKDDDKITSCIVTGNRMLYGYSCRETVVRPLHEMVRYIREGSYIQINIKSGEQKTIRSRESNELTAEDLHNFISYGLIQSLHATPHPYTVTFPYIGITVEQLDFLVSFQEPAPCPPSNSIHPPAIKPPKA